MKTKTFIISMPNKINKMIFNFNKQTIDINKFLKVTIIIKDKCLHKILINNLIKEI